jgi:hypothetical protein
MKFTTLNTHYKPGLALELKSSLDRRSSVGDQVIWYFEFYKVEDPEHLFGEGMCPLTRYVPFTYNSLSRIESI